MLFFSPLLEHKEGPAGAITPKKTPPKCPDSYYYSAAVLEQFKYH